MNPEKKVQLAVKKLAREGYNDIFSKEPTNLLFLGNSGYVCGIKPEFLYSKFGEIEGFQMLRTFRAKSYTFVSYKTVESAILAMERFNYSLTPPGTTLHMFYARYIPEAEIPPKAVLPKGLQVIPEFISAEFEKNLLQLCMQYQEQFDAKKNRSVLHFGFEFDYGSNSAYKQTHVVPSTLNLVIHKLQKYFGSERPDQITINRYQPGQSIPMHVDTHSAFEEPVISLSLQSYCHIDFVHCANPAQCLEVALPPRSLMVMMGESRYCWRHGIRPRSSDINQETGEVVPRGERFSITFRKTRSKACECPFIEYCDWDRNGVTAVPKNNEVARKIEKAYVQQVYEEIANHFSLTRHSRWNAVSNFLNSLPNGVIVLDAGCGNGKYLTQKTDKFFMGFDTCHNLLRVAKTKGEVMNGSLFEIPIRDSICDAVICIAVIHHFSTLERRRASIAEISRVLAPGGKAMITVWSIDQKTDGKMSAYAKMRSNKEMDELKKRNNGKLMIHDGTEFSHTDMLVPWQRNTDGVQLFRYYHLFYKGELDQLIESFEELSVIDSFYEEGNFIVTFQRNK